MKDELKKYVETNRPDFEGFKADSNSLWEGIEKGLDSQQKKGLGFMAIAWKVAASVILIVGVALFVVMNNQETNLQSENFLLKYVSPEIAQQEKYYADMIEQKMKVIQTNADNIDPVVMEDLKAMDNAYLELKKDLKDNADNKEVVQAMIENYKIKLTILEQILDQISLDLEEDNINESVSI